MAEPSSKDREESLHVPWPDVVQFVRQLSHDLRNYLNAADLTAAYINEVATDPALKAEIKRLRESIATAASALQKLSAAMGRVRVAAISYRVSEWIEDLRSKIASEFRDQSGDICWEMEPTDAALNIDPQLLQQAFIELFNNAFRHNRGEGPLVVSAKINPPQDGFAAANNQRLVFTLREPKSRFDLSTENWGREPLRSVAPHHYGLGLNRARAIIAAHGGELHARYEAGDSALVTTITLPLAP
jgi:signal transduction histidine kinase